MKNNLKTCLLALPIFVFANANAALMSLEGGMVYDDELDITWLADANYAKTSGYDADGIMSWEAANTWALGLSYGGYDNWRLPTAYNQDGTGPCIHPAACTDSEMGHLFYIDLGGTQDSSIYLSTDPDLARFSNIVTSDLIPMGRKYDTYWTSTAAWNSRKYYFAFSNGSQWAKNPDDIHGHDWGVAWAVHDGRLTPVIPEPHILFLLGIGTAALFLARKTA